MTKTKNRPIYQGFENTWNPLRMTLKMYFHTAVVSSMSASFVFFAGAYLYKYELLKTTIGYFFTETKYLLFSKISATDWLHYNVQLGWYVAKDFWFIFLTSAAVWIFLFFTLLGFFRRKSIEAHKPKYIRGTQIVETTELKELIKKSGEKVDIPVGDIYLPVNAEVKHAFVIGRPGVGKTVMMSQVLQRLKERKAKGIVYDFKGDYVSKFFDPERDILFNPLDSRCIGCQIFNEISILMDIEAVAGSLIPPARNEQAFFHDAARDVLVGILRKLHIQGVTTNMDIWRAVSAPGKEIADMLESTPGGERGLRAISGTGVGKQADGVLATLMQFGKTFEYMPHLKGDYSIQRWIENDGGGMIFVTNYADIQDTLRPILSLFVDLVGRRLLAMEDDYHRRVFFLIDELGTLQRLATIIRLLTLSRSKGGSVWLGIQDIGQLDKIYTSDHRQSIVNGCGNSAIFSVADPVAAKFLSDKIGDTEYLETEESTSMGVADNRDGVSLMRRKRLEKLILPSQIQSLPDLNCYLQVAGFPITQAALEYRSYPNREQMFTLRDGLNLAEIAAAQEKIIREAAEKTGLLAQRKTAKEKTEKEAANIETETKKRENGQDRDTAGELEFDIDGD